MTAAPFRAAVMQAAPIPFDASASAAKASDLIGEASRAGARLAVFPEAFLGGYPKGADLGAPLGLRLPAGREAFRRHYDAAVALDGPEVAVVAQAAADAGMVVVMGVVERDGATLFCSALIFDGSANLVAKHRKLMPTAAERLIWGQGDGSTLSVVPTGLGRIGAVICWENYMPALRMAMYDQGITLYCAPTVDDRDGWTATMRHVALEGRCFVLSACQHVTRAAFPTEFRTVLGDDPATVLIGGGSLIVAPSGEVLAGPDRDGETILYAELDPAELVRWRYDLDVVGHYSRPDVFRLIVDRSPRAAVEWIDRPDGAA